MYTDDELAVIALDSINGIEYKYKSGILQLVKNPSELFSFDENISRGIEKIIDKSKVNTVRLCFEKSYVDGIIQKLVARSVTAVTYLSKAYPESLVNISAFPLVLYCKGNLSLLSSGIRFGAVGSRKTLPYALKFCENVCRRLSEAGVVVVSGSADGADRASLCGALESGNVISVLAHGHDMCYPESNRELIGRVAEKGLVVSEYPPDFPSRAWTFPVRNRIIAGLSQGVLIVSGEMTSGARHTANYAVEYNRDVYALPYSIGVRSGELCNYLIKNGAYLCDCEEDVLSALNLEFQETAVALDGTETTVYNALKGGVDNVNDLILQSELKVFELAPVLSSLELKGLIVRLAGNKFKVIK